MEIQVTDHENAAFAIFIVLLTRAILSYGLNFYIPISKVEPPYLARGGGKPHNSIANLGCRFRCRLMRTWRQRIIEMRS